MRVCRLPAPGVQAVEVTRESSFLFLKSRPPGTNSPLPWAADTHGSSRQQGLWPHPCTYSLTPLGSSGQAWERMSEVLVRAGKVLGRPAADHGRPHQGQEGMSEMFILSDISGLTQLCVQCFASILPSTLPLSPFFREKTSRLRVVCLHSRRPTSSAAGFTESPHSAPCTFPETSAQSRPSATGPLSTHFRSSGSQMDSGPLISQQRTRSPTWGLPSGPLCPPSENHPGHSYQGVTPGQPSPQQQPSTHSFVQLVSRAGSVKAGLQVREVCVTAPPTLLPTQRYRASWERRQAESKTERR